MDVSSSFAASYVSYYGLSFGAAPNDDQIVSAGLLLLGLKLLPLLPHSLLYSSLYIEVFMPIDMLQIRFLLHA